MNIALAKKFILTLEKEDGTIVSTLWNNQAVAAGTTAKYIVHLKGNSSENVNLVV